MGIGGGPDTVPVPQTPEPIALPDYTERFARLQEMISSIGLVSTIVELEGNPNRSDLVPGGKFAGRSHRSRIP